MRTLIDLIHRHAGSDADFQYYMTIIENAEKNDIENPDISIECCASLFQGIAKTIVYNLEPGCDRAEFERGKVHNQVRHTLRCLAASDDIIEIGFPTAALNLVQSAGELRNARGDISHGRASPKLLASDRSLARLVLVTTEALVRYMLATYFAIRPEPEQLISYEDFPAFNDQLDEANPLEGKPLYSRALYDQFYEDYIIQLQGFEDELTEEGENG
ncbi:MAG: hypothetical protein CME84_14935 [Henriciella sp.]|nr:hypothetical protein [Henriciella sp.]|tara:strand:- start:1257 stop:1904 length:648 start_codon:yes stop_codon:yes gene_type:complete